MAHRVQNKRKGIKDDSNSMTKVKQNIKMTRMLQMCQIEYLEIKYVTEVKRQTKRKKSFN